MLNQIPATATFFSSDEVHFHLCRDVNKHNFRYWAKKNPRKIHGRPLHFPKITVWCAVFQFGAIGPYFFEDNKRIVTVTDRWTLCFNVERVFWTWTGRIKWGELSGRHLVSTGRGYGPYRLNFNDETATNVSRAPGLFEGWREVACALTTFEYL